MLVNTDLCNGLLPKGTKPLPEPKLTGIHEVLRHFTGKAQQGSSYESLKHVW